MMEFIYNSFDIIVEIIVLPAVFYLLSPLLFEDNRILQSIYMYIVMFKFLLDIPLSYYLNKFKNKRNNIILFHDVKFCIIISIIWMTDLKFLCLKGGLDNFLSEACLFIAIISFLESMIITIICFIKKEDKKKCESSLLITLILLIVMISSIIAEYKLIKLPTKNLYSFMYLLYILIGFIILSIPPIIMSFYAISSTFFTFYLIYKSIRKLFVRNKNIS